MVPSSVVKSFAEKAGVSIEEAEKRWKEAKEKAKDEGFKEGTVRFYKLTTTIFKKMMGQ